MAVEPLNEWKNQFENMPKTQDSSWAKKFADTYAKLIQNIETDPTALVSQMQFTFQKTIFENMLMVLPPTTSSAAGATAFAAAWEAAIIASIVAIPSGAFIPPSAPPTLFSSVILSVIDPISIVKGKTEILKLASSQPASNAQASEFPVQFHKATLSLTITVTGLDSTPPPSGPLPLTAAAIPLV